MQIHKTTIKAIFSLLIIIAFHSVSIAQNAVSANRQETITKNFTVTEFSTLKISSAFQVEFIHSNENKVSIEVDAKVSAFVNVSNVSNELSIKIQNCPKHNIHTLKATVYGNSLIAIFVNGASTFTSDYTFIAKEISIKNSCASRINIFVKTEKLEVDISGASKININGYATKLLLDASGASNYNGKKCKNIYADVSASGASKVIIDCSDTLDVKASGASSIKYISSPKTVNKVTSGASNVDSY